MSDLATVETPQYAGMSRGIAHAWCTCWERDGISPFPSLCGHDWRASTPEGEEWPDDRMACVLCVEMVEADAKCPRCGGPE